MNIPNLAISVSAKLNSHWYRHLGFQDRLVTVNEYPKSGGTWFAKLLATVIELPFVDRIIGPPSFPCVMRTHWTPRKEFRPAVYIIRDGRDVMTSLFHHRCKNIHFTPKLKRNFYEEYGEDLNVDRIDSQLSRFIDFEHSHNRYGAQCSWSEYTEKALEAVEYGQKSVLLKYEDLLEDPIQSVSVTIAKLFEVEIPADRIALAVEFYDKKWSQQNTLNLQNQRTFVRKGISGDWKNVFSLECCERFAKHGNTGLISMGYEKNPDWVRHLPSEGLRGVKGNG